MPDHWTNSLFIQNGPFAGNTLENISPVSGGCIHQAWRIELSDGQKIFAKTNHKDLLNALEVEAKGLKALKKWTNNSLITVPEPLLVEELSGTAVLLLPWLELSGDDQTALGQGLALMHQKSAKHNPEKFGWEEDGYIGKGIQPGGWLANWGEYFVNMRLIPQLKIASKWGLRIEDYQEILIALPSFLNEHQPSPSIVHGDLWGGNAAILQDGRGVLIDPAAWWADREVDIAMTKLFGGFSKKFYAGYEKVWPLPTSAQKRVEIYNLYHLINHANLFGGSYKEQCLRTLKTLKGSIIH